MDRPISFSLFYFASRPAEYEPDKYGLLLESVKFADSHDFEAVWVPERHFHAFGGIYPNPSVVAAALAMVTSRVRLRAGSVVLPLHNPIRVAEDWAVVDNLSAGRVDIAFARGWNPRDFVLAPDNHAQRTQKLYEGIDIIRELWQRRPVVFRDGLGQSTPISIFPLPRQSNLTIWLTCTGDQQRFVEAGERGFNVLTHAILHPLEDLATKVQRFREARASRGFSPGEGRVTLMLHTFLGSDEEQVRRVVKAPFVEYLASSMDLWSGSDKRFEDMSDEERAQVLDFAFERYCRTAALFGTPASCLGMVQKLRRIGVDEIACLIDFGVDERKVIDGLLYLDQLRCLANSQPEDSMHPDPVSSDNKTELLKRLLERKVAARGD